MITAFYSDPHFGHSNIIKYENRPFDNALEMNEALIKNYNNLIGPHDTVLWLGDCFLMPLREASTTLHKLNGHKLLIRGNHDRSVKGMLRIGFQAVLQDVTMLIGKHKCHFSHYPYGNPLAPVKSSEIDAILIHGHTHGKLRLHSDMIHVGVDAWDFKPVLLEQIETLLKERGPRCTTKHDAPSETHQSASVPPREESQRQCG